MFDVVTGQATQVAQHEAPIKVVGWVDAPGAGVLATGSWDKTIKVCLCFFFSIYVFSFFFFFESKKSLSSIGICGQRIQWRLFNFQKDAIHLTFNILFLLSARPNVMSKSLTCQIRALHTRFFSQMFYLFISIGC